MIDHTTKEKTIDIIETIEKGKDIRTSLTNTKLREKEIILEDQVLQSFLPNVDHLLVQVRGLRRREVREEGHIPKVQGQIQTLYQDPRQLRGDIIRDGEGASHPEKRRR